MSNQNQLTLDQLIQMINNSRADIVSAESNSSTIAINAFDGLTSHLKTALSIIQNQGKEIIRLQELCKVSNVDYAIPPPPPNPIIAPAPSTQELSSPPVEKVAPKISKK